LQQRGALTTLDGADTTPDVLGLGAAEDDLSIRTAATLRVRDCGCDAGTDETPTLSTDAWPSKEGRALAGTHSEAARLAAAASTAFCLRDAWKHTETRIAWDRLTVRQRPVRPHIRNSTSTAYISEAGCIAGYVQDRSLQTLA